ncbi:MAG TPA: class I SAM-dependent methyltransferase [Bryobacteraceae bacterium]|nr:class I SAM-dependent methyltransferase [Bryobacteraceae bacterium]
MTPSQPSQTFSVKRAQVEFHNFASLGEPERAMRVYREENLTRGSILRNHAEFIGPMTPFLEIGANAGHTSYMLANDFGAEGYALDISADALRHGIALQEQWNYTRAPIRIAGDGGKLPFRDNSIRFIMTCQTLSQFMDLESVFKEVTRVLAPGGVFLFAEEPMRRLLSLRLYRCPYVRTMKPWERKLFELGLLGYLVRDVIGAEQEESFGIRQNHRMYLNDWDALIQRHFVAREFDLFVPERGWGERWMKRLAVRLDPYHSTWRAARLLGGTLAAACRKGGEAVIPPFSAESFETALRCPDCGGNLTRGAFDVLSCTRCAYQAPNEGGVYNLLPTLEKKELYPGDREDVIDFSLPGHEQKLLDGWHALEGVYGNKFRWIGPHASAVLRRSGKGPQKVRIRGHAPEQPFLDGKPVTVQAKANGASIGQWTLERNGLFILEADLPDAPEYRLDIAASPEWRGANDQRVLTVTLSMLRLVPRDDNAIS